MKPRRLLLPIILVVSLTSCSKSDNSITSQPAQVIDTKTTDFRDTFCGEFRVRVGRYSVYYSSRSIEVFDTTILVGYASPIDSFRYPGPSDIKTPAIELYFRNSNNIIKKYWRLGILDDGKLVVNTGYSKGGFVGADSINTILNYTSNHYILDDTITGYRIR